MKYFLFPASIIILANACSFYEEHASGKFDPEKELEEHASGKFDPEKELEYLRYWCDPNHSSHNKSAGNPDDIRSQKECLKDSGHIGN